MEKSPVPNPVPQRPRSLFRELKLKAWKVDQQQSGQGRYPAPHENPASNPQFVPAPKDRQSEETRTGMTGMTSDQGNSESSPIIVNHTESDQNSQNIARRDSLKNPSDSPTIPNQILKNHTHEGIHPYVYNNTFKSQSFGLGPYTPSLHVGQVKEPQRYEQIFDKDQDNNGQIFAPPPRHHMDTQHGNGSLKSSSDFFSGPSTSSTGITQCISKSNRRPQNSLTSLNSAPHHADGNYHDHRHASSPRHISSFSTSTEKSFEFECFAKYLIDTKKPSDVGKNAPYPFKGDSSHERGVLDSSVNTLERSLSSMNGFMKKHLQSGLESTQQSPIGYSQQIKYRRMDSGNDQMVARGTTTMGTCSTERYERQSKELPHREFEKRDGRTAVSLSDMRMVPAVVDQKMRENRPNALHFIDTTTRMAVSHKTDLQATYTQGMKNCPESFKVCQRNNRVPSEIQESGLSERYLAKKRTMTHSEFQGDKHFSIQVPSNNRDIHVVPYGPSCSNTRAGSNVHISERNYNTVNQYGSSYFAKSRRCEDQSQDITGSDSGVDGPVTSSDINGRTLSPPTMTASGQLELDRRAITEGLLNCEICEDRATGLHYGTVTCEGCKGFFKRTVQNKKIYKCSRNEDCVVSRSCRNRCQYCRFKKCLHKGMVMAAVRQDRMPGGRNSGAVYDMYKVKYKKHRRKSRATSNSQDDSGSQRSKSTSSDVSYLPEHLNNYSSHHAKVSQKWLDDLQKYTPGACLESARDTSDEALIKKPNANGEGHIKEPSQKERPESIQKIINCEHYQDIAKFAYRVEHELNASRVLGTLGDDIVYHLVRWAQSLPFHSSIPMSKFLQILTSKWHEVLFLTTTAYQTLLERKAQESSGESLRMNMGTQGDLGSAVEKHIQRLCVYMNDRLHKNTSLSQLRQEVQVTMEKVTLVIRQFSLLQVTMEEYVCLKIILLFNTEGDTLTEGIARIQEDYISILQDYITSRSPNSPNRLGELILLLPQIQSAASLLLQSRMIFVPFLLSNLSKDYRSTLRNSQPSFSVTSSSCSSSGHSSLVKPPRIKRHHTGTRLTKVKPSNLESGYSTGSETTFS